MSTALKTGDSKLALREVSKLSINRILDMREAWNDAAFELKSARNSLKFLEENKDVQERKKSIKQVTAYIRECESKLARLPKLPMLGMLQKENEEGLLDTLQLLVINVVKFHHTTEKMAPEEIFECAFRIANEFKGLTLEDVALCFYQAQNGAYGEVYNRIDGGVLMNWLHDYQDRLQSLGMERELQRHIQGKGETYRRGSDYRIVEPRKLRDWL